MYPIIRLNEVDCRDCYKCIRKCLLKAIRYSNGHAEIIQDECIGCGECVVTCPRRSHYVMTDLDEIKRAARSGRTLVASVDPAFVSDFDVSCIEDLREAMAQIGFSEAQETAIGGEIVSREYERIMRGNETDALISSACPAVNQLIRKYYPDLLKFLAPVESPMVVHCKRLRREYPEAMIVYIGPCYARKDEALEMRCCDGVMLFSELKAWMYERGVACVNSHTVTEHGIRARRYPRKDGIVRSMSRIPGWSRVSIDGVEDCMAALEEMRQGSISHAFLEMTACAGSCVNGPAIRSNRYENRVRGTIAVNSYAGDYIFGVQEARSVRTRYAAQPVRRVEPDEALVQQVLEKLGKSTAETALNCGCCGYPTCREMAYAICQGKAETDMCLPYLHAQTEHRSQEVVNSTLEAADRVIDKQMRVVQEIASILGETTAETKIMLEKLKEAVQA